MRTTITSTIFLLVPLLFWAQPKSELRKQVLFTVEEDTVTAGEYMAVYTKNLDLGNDVDPKSPRQYLELYKNFKLKVQEAKNLGLDTMPQFLREYNNYRDQLAEPYLSDEGVTEELVREAFKRSKKDVRASHIMVELPPNASPKDTLKAYREIQNIREKLEKGASFAELVREHSDDDYSARKGGDLGFFTVFDMVYPFESAAYETPQGQVSSPIRTKYGYHLVKPTEKRDARGSLQVRHIMLVANDQSSEEEKGNARERIQEIYEKAENGEDFRKLARQYSDDKQSGYEGGLLEPFGINKMYPVFEEAAFALEDSGDVTEPVKTPVGWHIIQLVRGPRDESFSQAKRRLRNKVESDLRAKKSRESVLKSLKSDYNFREYPQHYSKVFDQVSPSLLKGQWKLPQQIEDPDAKLFEFAGKEYTTLDFLQYLQRSQDSYTKFEQLEPALYQAISDYSRNQLIAYEKQRLPEKYPKFRLLNREYYEGILLFNVTEQEVWNKAVRDTSGLKSFYEKRKDQYRWNERYRLYKVDAASKKLIRKARRSLKKGQRVNSIKRELNQESKLAVNIDSTIVERGSGLEDSALIPREEGFSDIVERNERYILYFTEEVLPPRVKELAEVRGRVASDYQQYLEKKWMEKLRSKYKVKVDGEVLDQVVKVLDGGE